jgi:ribosomal protein S18 acetylase RimI-like enzyme
MVRIQRATPDDAETLTHIQFEAFAKADAVYANVPNYEPPPDYDSANSQREAIIKQLYFKIVREGEIVGGLILMRESDDHISIARIFIKPSLQNEGLGTQALRFMELIFPRCRRWTVLTPFLSFRNHHFYEKLGYVKIGETEPYLPNGYVLYLYEKRIQPNKVSQSG